MTDDPILAKIRALIAQAESTNYEAEAETFMSAAERLMMKHSIDQAMLDASGKGGDGSTTITTRTVRIDSGYAGPKALLLTAIAKSMHCQVLVCDRFRVNTIYGTDRDIDAVMALFTSLELQGTRWLLREPTPPGVSSKSFRQGWWQGYGGRVGARVQERARGVEHNAAEETSGGSSLVLASRDQQVADAVRRDHPRLRTMRPGGGDWSGRGAGRAAGGRADLGGRRIGGTRKELNA